MTAACVAHRPRPSEGRDRIESSLVATRHQVKPLVPL